jgi:crossover junction endodeoxyribonuclease RuvC
MAAGAASATNTAGGPGEAGAPDVPGAVILGIDPGTATTGYGIVRSNAADAGEVDGAAFTAVAYGAIETPASDPMPARLLVIHRELRRVVAEYRPSQVAVEQLFFGRNTTTALTVGQARGVALLAVAEAGLPVVEYTPLEVKHAIAGFGRAQKHQMQRMIQALLGLPTLPRPDDAADALAIALCHARLAPVRALGLR